jgi:hypothetical protein
VLSMKKRNKTPRIQKVRETKLCNHQNMLKYIKLDILLNLKQELEN